MIASYIGLPALAQTPGSVSWVQTFGDEFNASAGTLPDSSKWTMETGGGGWGNNEWQTYTARPENAAHDGNGHLVITARYEPNYLGTDGIRRDYTSARLKTQGKFNQTYGRFETRLRVPGGQGIWPAFWMLGEDIATEGWPNSGEIDVMEFIGREPNNVYGTIHGPGYSGAGGIGASYSLPNDQAFPDAMHHFAVEWTPNRIDWFVNGQRYQTRTPQDLGGNTWAFDDEFFMLLNLAVGGNWPGYPDASTPFPRELVVDYVRVSERQVATRPTVDNGTFLAADDQWAMSGNAYVESHDPTASPSRITLNGPGDSALKMFGTFVDGGAETRAAQPFVSMDGNTEKLLLALVRTNSDDSISGTSNELVMFVDFFDNYDQYLGSQREVVLDGTSLEDQWLTASLEVQAPADSAYATIGFDFIQPDFEGGAAWIDGVSFGAYSIPEPTSIAFMTTTALLLVRRRRNVRWN